MITGIEAVIELWILFACIGWCSLVLTNRILPLIDKSLLLLALVWEATGKAACEFKEETVACFIECLVEELLFLIRGRFFVVLMREEGIEGSRWKVGSRHCSDVE